MNKKTSSILVVDDIEMNRAMLTKIFSDTYIIYEAENGRDAMNVLRGQDVDMVLLDLSMPVMDGYEVITAMRMDKKLAVIPIVVTTGGADNAERKAFALGADDYITKPYDPYIVRKRVDNLIQKYVLQMDNMHEALERANALNRAKSDFLSRMSHDLRSPLNGIISMATLTSENSKDAQAVVSYCNKILESGRYLLGVINDILDTSALENQKITITRSPFDFRRQIESIASMFYGQCKEKNISFKLYLANFTEEYLFGDPLRLKEVLVNLISNAVKFTPNGGHIQVRVSQLSRLADMVMLRFEVQDDGEGIAKERQESIFEPYSQESAGTVQKHGGSGLGLSIVKNIVQLMGGNVSVDSEKGKGSTFTVELPFTVSKELPEVSSEKLKSVRALIVDDDIETQEYGQKMMGKMGIQCDVASNGKEALHLMETAFAESHGYDICFIDWRMPGMTGIDITREIRRCFDDDTIIVVASSYDVTEINEEAKMAGANVVVAKPMFQSTVFDLLMNITGGQYAQGEEASKYHFNGKTVLVAEDNTLNAEMAEEILHLVGFTTMRAIDGKDACEQFEKSPVCAIDAIIMDVQMPVMNGYEATRHIRECGRPDSKSVPIIAVTANAFTEDVKKSLNAGMNAHIAKPIDTVQLYQTLDKFVGQTK